MQIFQQKHPILKPTTQSSWIFIIFLQKSDKRTIPKSSTAKNLLSSSFQQELHFNFCSARNRQSFMELCKWCVWHISLYVSQANSAGQPWELLAFFIPFLGTFETAWKLQTSNTTIAVSLTTIFFTSFMCNCNLIIKGKKASQHQNI